MYHTPPGSCFPLPDGSLDLLYPLRPPEGRLKRIGPELGLVHDLSVLYLRKRDDPPADHAICHVNVRDDLIAFRQDAMDGEFPASVGGVLLVDRDKILAPAHPFLGLRPLEHVFLMQEFAGSSEVIGLHGLPALLDDSFTNLIYL
jgi:hypothetical protein